MNCIDMTSLPKEHLEVHAFMEAEGFSVKNALCRSLRADNHRPDSRGDNKERHLDSWKNETTQIKSRCTAALLHDY